MIVSLARRVLVNRCRLAVVALTAALASPAAAQLLRLHGPTLTSSMGSVPGLQTPAQGVRPGFLQRGTGLDGDLREPSPFGWSIHANPFPESWNDARRFERLRLDSGTYDAETVDLALPAPAFSWVVGTTYNGQQGTESAPHTSDGYQGNNRFQSSNPEVVLRLGAGPEDDVLCLVYGADRFVEFRRAAASGPGSGAFVGVNGAGGGWTVVREPSGGGVDTFVYYDQTGLEVTFFAPDDARIPAPKRGQLWRIIRRGEDAGGVADDAVAYVGDPTDKSAALALGYNADGAPRVAYDTAGRRYEYTYRAVAGRARLTLVEVSRLAGSDWTPTGDRVEYSYYEQATPGRGNAGDLELIRVTRQTSDPGRKLVYRTYYRYYTDPAHHSASRGYPSLLRLVVEPEGCRAYDWSGENGQAPGVMDDAFRLTATLADLQKYAAVSLEYEADVGNLRLRRVDRVRFNGECGCAGGVNGEYRLAYDRSGEYASRVGDSVYAASSGVTSTDLAWTTRATVAPPVEPSASNEATWRVQYFDEVGQPLSRVETARWLRLGVRASEPPAGGYVPGSSSSSFWADYVTRDAGGSIAARWWPAAVEDYVYDATGGAAPTPGRFQLRQHDGLVRLYERVPDGELMGFLRAVRYREPVRDAQNGSTSGSRLLLESWTDYDLASMSPTAGLTVARPRVVATRAYKTRTEMEGVGGVDYDRTLYAWSMHSGQAALSVKEERELPPVVTAANNGPGVQLERRIRYRPDGTVAFEVAPDGLVTYYRYSGGLLDRVIEDADTSRAADFAPDVPSSFGVSSQGAPIHRVTAYEYLGETRRYRTTRYLGSPDEEQSLSFTTALGDGREVTLDVPRVTSVGAAPTYLGPVAYGVLNLAGLPTFEAHVRVASTPAVPLDQWIVTAGAGDDPLTALAQSAGSVGRLTTHLFAEAGRRVLEVRRYHTIPPGLPGGERANYDATTFSYDNAGRLRGTVHPGRTLVRRILEPRGGVAGTDVGTVDLGGQSTLENQTSEAGRVVFGEGRQRSGAIDLVPPIDPVDGTVRGPGGAPNSRRGGGGSGGRNSGTLRALSRAAAGAGGTGAGGGGGGGVGATTIDCPFDAKNHNDSPSRMQTHVFRDVRDGLLSTWSTQAWGFSGWTPDRDGRLRPVTVVARDGAGRAVAVARYEPPFGLSASGTWSSEEGGPIGADPLLPHPARREVTEYAYDEWGRIFRQTRRAIGPDGAEVAGEELVTSYWYDPVGRLVKVSGELNAKYAYDRLGRLTHEFTLARDDDGGSYAAAYDSAARMTRVDGDMVLSETRYGLNPRTGDALLTAVFRRFHDDADTTGPLYSDLASTAAYSLSSPGLTRGRPHVVAHWFDELHRPRKSAVLGTNGGADIVRAALAEPTGSDQASLVSSTVYDGLGRVAVEIPPAGTSSATTLEYDAADRPTRTVEAYYSGAVGGATSDRDRVTEFAYGYPENGAGVEPGFVRRVTVRRPATGGDSQTTTYIYGTTWGFPNRPATGYLLSRIQYPAVGEGVETWQSVTSPASGSPYAGRLRETVINYNRAGRRTSLIERMLPQGEEFSSARPTEVDYGYYRQLRAIEFDHDIAGNEIARWATDYTSSAWAIGTANSTSTTDLRRDAPGSPYVPTAIRRAYDWRGRLTAVTQCLTYHTGNPTGPDHAVAVDSVRFEYDTWGNVRSMHQDAALTASGTPGVPTRSVAYQYARSAVGRAALRRTHMIYPDGYTLKYGYLGAVDVAAGRVSELAESHVMPGGGAAVEIPLARYQYLGEDDLVGVRLPEPGALRSDYEDAAPRAYGRLDRFDRPVVDRWSRQTGDPTRPLAHFHNTDIVWDANSNPVSTDSHFVPDRMDVRYTYDNLDRLVRAEQGALVSGTIGTRTRDEQWTLGQTGNWVGHLLDGDGNDQTTWSTDLNENNPEDGATPSFNRANELRRRNPGNGAPAQTLKYDYAGSLVDDGVNFLYRYDVFGRLTEVRRRAEGNALVCEYRYNGLGHRTAWRYDSRGAGTGTAAEFPDGVVDGHDPWWFFVHDETWRAIAVYRTMQAGVDATGRPLFSQDASPKERFVHHAAGLDGLGGSSALDAMVLRDRDAETWTRGGGPTRASDGVLEERRYLAQNRRGDVVSVLGPDGRQHFHARYSPYGQAHPWPAGDLDGDGYIASAELSQVGAWAYSGAYDPRGDLDLNGVVNIRDQELQYELSSRGVTGGAMLSPWGAGLRRAWAGYELDPVVGRYHVRHRAYAPELGRWLQRDPIGYNGGSFNLYEYVVGGPIRYTDPLGLMPDDRWEYPKSVDPESLRYRFWGPPQPHQRVYSFPGDTEKGKNHPDALNVPEGSEFYDSIIKDLSCYPCGILNNIDFSGHSGTPGLFTPMGLNPEVLEKIERSRENKEEQLTPALKQLDKIFRMAADRANQIRFVACSIGDGERGEKFKNTFERLYGVECVLPTGTCDYTAGGGMYDLGFSLPGKYDKYDPFTK